MKWTFLFQVNSNERINDRIYDRFRFHDIWLVCDCALHTYTHVRIIHLWQTEWWRVHISLLRTLPFSARLIAMKSRISYNISNWYCSFNLPFCLEQSVYFKEDRTHARKKKTPNNCIVLRELKISGRINNCNNIERERERKKLNLSEIKQNKMHNWTQSQIDVPMYGNEFGRDRDRERAKKSI